MCNDNLTCPSPPNNGPEASLRDTTAVGCCQQYGTVLAALQTLFATQTAQFVESALQAICARLKVKYHGPQGPLPRGPSTPRHPYKSRG